MQNKSILFLPLALFLSLSLPFPPAVVEEPPCPGPAVQIIPPLADHEAPELEEAPTPPPEIHVIENCTVTWYTADTCGKSPDHPGYGIAASGLPAAEDITCAVDPAVIPLGSEVQVFYADGTIGRFLAMDTGVKGNWVDIYTPDYDYAIQCGLQRLKVCWIETEGNIRS